MTAHPLALLADLADLLQEAELPRSTRRKAEIADQLDQTAEALREYLMGVKGSDLRAQAQEMALAVAERDSLLGGVREAVRSWTQKREANRRDGDRRAEIIYGAVVERALGILNDEAGPELSENDVVSIPDGGMNARPGEFTADIFRSSNDVRNGGVPLMTMQVYGPDYEETTDFISFYFEREKVQELCALLGRFLALPIPAQAGGGS